MRPRLYTAVFVNLIFDPGSLDCISFPDVTKLMLFRSEEFAQSHKGQGTRGQLDQSGLNGYHFNLEIFCVLVKVHYQQMFDHGYQIRSLYMAD